MLDLPAESATRVAHDGYREAAFSVDEADGPLLYFRPFLLIDRTGWIVTLSSTTGYTVIPAYGQIL